MRRTLAALVTVLIASVGVARGVHAADAVEDGQFWLLALASGPIHGRLLGWLDLQARLDDDASGASLTLVRPALGWRVGRGVDLWAGYARIDLLREGLPDVGEHRAWQQATFPIGAPFGGVLSGRTRLEQRFVETGDDVGWRVRQLVRFGRRFGGTPFSAVVWDEVFFALNDTDWGADAGFDQNRIFVGPAWHATSAVRVELGYLNQWIRRGQAPDRVNHALSLNLLLVR